MKVTQEVLPDSQVGLEIEVSPEMSQKTYEQVLRKLMRTVNVPGFRKGKVPKKVFLQRIGLSQFKAAVLEELVQDAIDQAIKQESIEAIGNYQLRSSFEDLIIQYEPGQALTIAAAVDVPPRVTLRQYRDLTIETEEVIYSPERLKTTLEQYRNNLATLVPVEDRTAAMGDMAVIDFVGKVTNDEGELEEFSGGQATDFQVELSSGRFIPGFVEGIEGMALDESKDLDLNFPEDYPQADLAGKPVVFSVTLKELKEKELPDLDDDFAQEISEFETLEELSSSLEERYREEAEEQTKANKSTAILDALVEYLDAEIPNTLIQKEVDYLLTQTIIRLSNQGIDVNKLLTRDLVASMRERTRPDAIDRLRRTLALGEVAKQESIEIDEEIVKDRINEAVQAIEDPSQIDPDRLQQVIREEVLQETILDWLEAHNTITLVPEGTLTKAEEEAVADVQVNPDNAVAVTEPDTDTATDTVVDASADTDQAEAE